MPNPPARHLRFASAVLGATLTALAQDQPRFVMANELLLGRVAVDDLPGLVAALQQGALAPLWRSAEFQQSLQLAGERIAALRAQFALRQQALADLAPQQADLDTRLTSALLALPWSSLHSGEVLAGFANGANDPTVVVSLRGDQAGQQALTALWQRLLAGELTGGNALPVDESVAGRPVCNLQASNPNGTVGWAARYGEWFLGGAGAATEAGAFASIPPPAPGIGYELHFGNYVRMLTGLLGGVPGQQQASAVLEALGLADLGTFGLQVEAVDGLLQERLVFHTKAERGLLGALVNGMAPLPDQPLPEGALLQIRCGCDLPLLQKAINDLLSATEVPNLDALGLAADLQQAFTGGIALAVCRPAPGGLVPRFYASLGIADQAAFARWFEAARKQLDLPFKELALGSGSAWQVVIPDAPPAVQPALWLDGGTLHLAESVASLRALRKAAASGAAKAMDVGNAPRPPGKGGLLPGVDVRFDNRALYTTLHQVWLPLLELQAKASDGHPLLTLDELPDPELVAPLLGPGRGVLRRTPDRVTLAMASPTGGPYSQFLLSACGTIAGLLLDGMHSHCQDLGDAIANVQLPKIHAALAAYEKRTGQRAPSLGVLVAAGDLPAELLLVAGDELAEPVEHVGQVLGKSSYRYFPAERLLDVDGQQYDVELLVLAPGRWQRTCMVRSGDVRAGWGQFNTPKVDDLLRQ